MRQLHDCRAVPSCRSARASESRKERRNCGVEITAWERRRRGFDTDSRAVIPPFFPFPHETDRTCWEKLSRLHANDGRTTDSCLLLEELQCLCTAFVFICRRAPQNSRAKPPPHRFCASEGRGRVSIAEPKRKSPIFVSHHRRISAQVSLLLLSPAR